MADPRRWTLVATILGSSMVFIDGTVVNVALPAIQAEFSSTVRALQWVVEAYALMLASLLLVGGALGDRYGRKRMFVIGTAIFGLASLACGLAPTAPWLIAARAAQGLGAAALAPASLALLRAHFPADEQGRAIGTWAGFTSMMAALGPPIGGWLVENASWRWAFWINLPLAAAVIGAATLRVPEARDPSARGRPDLLGAALASLALGAFVYGLIEASEHGWRDLRILGALGGGAVLGALFVVVERRVAHPMVPPSLFRSRTFTGANLLTLFLYAGLNGVFFFLPLRLIQVQGYSATQAGLALMPVVLCLFLLSRLAGRVADRIGPRTPLVVGPALAGLGFALLAIPGVRGDYLTSWLPALVVLGVGMAANVAPLTTAVMAAAPERHAGAASGVNNAVSRTGAVLAVAALGALAVLVFGHALEGELGHLPADVRESVLARKAELGGLTLPDGAGPAVGEAVRVAFVTAFRVVVLVTAGLALISAAIAYFTIEDQPSR